MKQSIPQRLRESTFRNFENDIAMLVEQYPLVTTFKDLHGFAPATFSARLRDAMASLATFRWPTIVKMDTFLNAWRKGIMVSHQPDGIIYAGHRNEMREHLASKQVFDDIPEIAAEAVDTTPLTITIYQFDEASVVAFLAANKALSRPIEVLGLTDEIVKQLEDHFDVFIKKNPSGSHTIL